MYEYNVKRHADGSITRYKARLATKGYIQIEGLDFLSTLPQVPKTTTIRVEGLDYLSTLSPVPKATTIRMILASAR